MRRLAYALTAVAAFGAVAAPRLLASEEPPAPAASPEEQAQIARRIEELGSADFRVREAATKALIELGAKARPALEKALQSDNPAVRFRADQLLQGLEGKAGERKLDEGSRPEGSPPDRRPEPSVRPSGRAEVERSMEEARRDMERAIREMQEQWGRGRFDDKMKDVERQLREFQEQLERQLGEVGRGGMPGGGPGGRALPGWLESWTPRMASRALEVAAEVDGFAFALSERPGRAKLEIRSLADRAAVATFTAGSADALLAAYPVLRTWSGVPDLVAKLGDAKAERAKAEEEARQRAGAGRPGRTTATNRSVAIESSDGHVKVTISETGPDGKPVTKTYEGTDLETLRAQHPELKDALGGFSMRFGPGTTFGPGTGFGPGGPFGPGTGPRPLREDDDGEDDDGEDGGLELTPPTPRTGPFGLALAPVDDDLRAHLGLAAGSGALVALVREGSDAAKLGFEADDVVVRVNDAVVKQLGDVGAAIRAVPEGGALVVEVLRGGKPLTLKR